MAHESSLRDQALAENLGGYAQFLVDLMIQTGNFPGCSLYAGSRHLDADYEEAAPMADRILEPVREVFRLAREAVIEPAASRRSHECLRKCVDEPNYQASVTARARQRHLGDEGREVPGDQDA